MSYAIKMIKVECDGAVHEFPDKIRVGKVIKEVHGKKTGAIAALVNDEEKDLSYLLTQDCKIDLIKDDSDNVPKAKIEFIIILLSKFT